MLFNYCMNYVLLCLKTVVGSGIAIIKYAYFCSLYLLVQIAPSFFSAVSKFAPSTFRTPPLPCITVKFVISIFYLIHYIKVAELFFSSIWRLMARNRNWCSWYHLSFHKLMYTHNRTIHQDGPLFFWVPLYMYVIGLNKGTPKNKSL